MGDLLPQEYKQKLIFIAGLFVILIVGMAAFDILTASERNSCININYYYNYNINATPQDLDDGVGASSNNGISQDGRQLQNASNNSETEHHSESTKPHSVSADGAQANYYNSFEDDNDNESDADKTGTTDLRTNKWKNLRQW